MIAIFYNGSKVVVYYGHDDIGNAYEYGVYRDTIGM